MPYGAGAIQRRVNKLSGDDAFVVGQMRQLTSDGEHTW